MFQVIIYDCDGVLVDSREANRAFYNHILDRFGLGPLTEAQLAVVHVSTAQGAIDFLFQDHPGREEAQAYQRTINNDPFLPLIRPEPNIREVLVRLRSRYLTAIATNRGKSLPLVLRRLGLDDLFDLTVSAYDVTRPKPHPECLEKILTPLPAGAGGGPVHRGRRPGPGGGRGRLRPLRGLQKPGADRPLPPAIPSGPAGRPQFLTVSFRLFSPPDIFSPSNSNALTFSPGRVLNT